MIAVIMIKITCKERTIIQLISLTNVFLNEVWMNWRSGIEYLMTDRRSGNIYYIVFKDKTALEAKLLMYITHIICDIL
jgi:hypothetical protein